MNPSDHYDKELTQDTKTRIWRGFVLRMLGQSMPPAPIPVKVIDIDAETAPIDEQECEKFKIPPGQYPLTVHNKFLLQISVDASSLGCCCGTCRQQQRVALQLYLKEMAQAWLDRVNPLNLKHPPLYRVNVTSEP